MAPAMHIIQRYYPICCMANKTFNGAGIQLGSLEMLTSLAVKVRHLLNFCWGLIKEILSVAALVNSVVAALANDELVMELVFFPEANVTAGVV